MTDYLLKTEGDLIFEPTTANLKLRCNPVFDGAGSALTWRSNLGLSVGSDVQAYNSKLADVAGVSTANSVLYYDGNNVAEAPSTAFGRSVLNEADSTSLRNAISAQISHQYLDEISNLTPADGDVIKYDNGSGAWISASNPDETTAGNGLQKSGEEISIDTSVTVDLTSQQILENKASIISTLFSDQGQASLGYEVMSLDELTTINATETILKEQDIGNYEGQTVELTVMGVNQTNQDINCYKFKFVAYKGATSADAVIKGTTNQEILAEDDINVSASVVADTTNGSWKLNVTGSSSNDVNWTCKAKVLFLS